MQHIPTLYCSLGVPAGVHMLQHTAQARVSWIKVKYLLSVDDTVRVQHGDDLEDVALPQLLGGRFGAHQEVHCACTPANNSMSTALWKLSVSGCTWDNVRHLVQQSTSHAVSLARDTVGYKQFKKWHAGAICMVIKLKKLQSDSP